jgi:hypothetical protein
VDSCENLVRFLFSVGRDLVEPTKMKTLEDGEDEEVSSYLLQQHEKWIIPPVGDPRRISRIEGELDALRSQGIQMNFTMGRMTEALETQNALTSQKIKLTEEKMDKKKDRLSKYHPQLINALKNIASIDGVDPGEIAPGIMAIISCESHSSAEQELFNQFKEKGSSTWFAPGTSRAIYELRLTWPSQVMPTNVSPFTIQRARINDTSMNDRSMFLSTWETHGKDLTDDEIKKKLKQVILIPETYLQFCDQLKIFIDTIKILSGDESKATYILEDFQELVIAERDKL